MDLTLMDEQSYNAGKRCESVFEKSKTHFEPVGLGDSPGNRHRVTALPCGTCWTGFSPTNPFLKDIIEGHGTFMSPCCEAPQAVATPHSNPFRSAHQNSFVQSTPHLFPRSSPHVQCSLPEINKSENVCGRLSEQTVPMKGVCDREQKSKQHVQQKSGSRRRLSSESEEEADFMERIPTLRPGQYDGTTPWREFLRTFENCATANHWSEKTRTIQLKFCLVGAAGAIITRNPRSSRWDYARLVEEMETAYGPSSEHAAAVAIELRQRVRQVGEPLHVLRDDIYDRVSVAYGDRTEAEQDAIGVEIFTNALRDADIVQRLLEQRPRTLAHAFDIARSYETTRRAASCVANPMTGGGCSMPDRRTRAAVIKAPGQGKEMETAAPPRVSPHSQESDHFKLTKRISKDSRWKEVRCHNCSGLGHLKRNCPSPYGTVKGWSAATDAVGSQSEVLQLNSSNKEMSIRLNLHGLEVCAVLDSGASKSVLPLHYFESVPPVGRAPLQGSPIKTLLGVGPGDIPVLGEAHVPVQINKRMVTVHFLVADIRGEEVLLGHPFLVQAQAQLDFGKQQIVLFGEEVPYFSPCLNTQKLAVKVARTVVLEAGREYVVPGKVCGRRPLAGDVMMSPTKGFVERHKVLVARTLVRDQVSKFVPLRFFNPSNTAVTIKGGAVAGFLQPAQVVESNEVSSQTRKAPSDDPCVPQHLQELFHQSSAELGDQEQHQLAQLLCSFGSVFSTGPADLGRTNMVQHDIITRPGPPVKQPPRRMAWEKQQSADQQITQGLEAGFARPSNSSWASPIVMVRKKDGTHRLCVDYRALNDCTIKDAYPLPRIQDTLDTLSTAKWFSTLDLASGYWQVELTPRARKAAAFCTRTGLFEWTVMPFGLCNAPATFQRLMDRVLVGMQWETCLVYLDDIIVLGKDVSEMLERLGLVFDRLCQANLKLKPSKCCLFRRKVNYLGHIVSGDGVATDPEKVQQVHDWPVPNSLQEVRQFLGLASYYRRFVKDFATIAEPLHALTKKNVRFQWTEKCHAAFNCLKGHLTTAPVLGYPLDEGEMMLDTDASDVGIGAVLSQMQDGEERVLAYGSRKLTKTEQNYCTTRRELLAVVEFTSHFRQYLLGRPFTVRTDHSSLRWLTKMKEPEGQLARWLERLGEYDFEVIHRSGHSHSNADSMSRRPCRQSCACKHPEPSSQSVSVNHQAVQCELDSVIHQVMQSPVGVVEAQSAAADSIQHSEKVFITKTKQEELFRGWSLEELLQAQEADPDIAPIRGFILAGKERPPWEVVATYSPASKTYWSQWKRLYLRDGVLLRRFYCVDETEFYPQIVLPRALRSGVLKQMHEGEVGGHFGVERTVARLQTRYFWYQMREDVTLWCSTCTRCASKARPLKKPQAPMGTVGVGAPMERVALDIMGPLNETDRGNKYILVVQDYFTKVVEAFPIPNDKAVTVAEVFASQWVCRYGAPQTLHSDQGRNFESEVFQKMCTLFGIEKTHTTPFRPQSDGQVERFNATLQKILATTADHCHWDWDLMIPYAVMAYRATKHSSTGFTPNFMLFGREVSEPVDLVAGLPPDDTRHVSEPEYVQKTRERLELAHGIAREALGESSRRAKRQYDKNCCRTQYKVGDAVWYLVKGTKNPKNRVKKFLPSYEGPYFIIGQLDDLIYRIQRGPKTKVKVVHHDQLKPYLSRIPLDNRWAIQHAEDWVPVEVPPPALDTDSSGLDADLSLLFSGPGADGSCTTLDQTVDNSPATSNQACAQDSGGKVADVRPKALQPKRPVRRRKGPVRYGDWILD